MHISWPKSALKRLQQHVLTVRDCANLATALAWSELPILEGHPQLHRFEYLEDLNQRRLRDAEVVGGACRNAAGDTLVEIGTGLGHMTAIMAENAPSSTVFTINIPPEEIDRGGSKTTFAPSREQIGSYYRQRTCQNIVQIFENTTTWRPRQTPIDVAFIDGCHDADFVYNDTKKILAACRAGSIIMWHDFSPPLAQNYSWIQSVCRGVSRLFRERLLRGRVLHLQDSWVGLYVVGEGEGGAE